ncbi:omptin family outer membrane protease [Pantoea sp. FN0305]|uniref:omptin family outer membrane protease n=1 Tax=Pantoea sp. FN0305 TaxID=3418559 RepID=UPI003CF6D250
MKSIKALCNGTLPLTLWLMSPLAIANSLPSYPVTFTLATGWLGGKSNEYVYDEGHKNSELDWKIKNAAVIRGHLDWEIAPQLSLALSGWTTLARGSAQMDDYDWMVDNQSHWSDWSTWPAARLNYANQFAVSITGWLLQQPEYKLGAALGYQQTRISWQAQGGSYIYDNGADIGRFSRDERAAAYQQRFSAPWLGIAGQYRYKKLELNALIKYSPFTNAHDNDEHYTDYNTFRVKTRRSDYWAASMDAGYYLSPQLKVLAALSWEDYRQSRGQMQIIDYDQQTYDYSEKGGGGVSHKNYSLTAGLQYHF